MNGSAGCKMGEAVAGSLGPGEIWAPSLKLAACPPTCAPHAGPANSIVGEAQTLWSCLSGETCALQESQIGSTKS